MSVLRVKNGDQWDIVPAIKGDTGDPAADESITDAMLVPDGIKTEIDWLWGNQLMDIREGELLQTDDAYKGPLVSLDVDGKSTQVMTTGKNLLNPDTYQSPWTEFYLSSTWDGAVVESSSNYKLGFIIEVPSGESVTYSCAKRITFHLAWIDGPIEIGSTVSGAISTENRDSFTSTNSTDATRYLLVYFNYSGRTSTQKIIIINDKVQIERGASATAYESYTGLAASPRPDWPQEIVSIDEPSLLIAGGKNLIDWAHPFKTGSYHYDIAIGTVVTPTTNTNVEVSMDGNTLVSVVKAGWNGAVWRSPNLPNGTYRMYFQKTDASGTTGTAVGTTLFVVNKDNMCVRKVGNHATSGDWNTTITLSDDEAAICVCAGTRSGTYGTYMYAMPQLEAGSTATDYEPYAGATVPLLPDGYSLRSLPDGTKDELHLSYLRPSTREGWAWYDRELVQRVDSVDLGTLTWTTNYSGDQQKWTGVFTNATIASWVSVNRFMCSGYKVLGSQAISAAFSQDAIIMHRANNGRTVMVHDSRYISDTTPEQFREAVDGVIWQYVLATPITTQLDPIELPIMPSKDATIWSDPSAQLKMTYIQDTNLVIQSLEATVADMATS